MKNILGSLIFLSLSLLARSEYEWNVDLKDRELYLNQSTVLTMQCSFSKEGKNDDVEFSPPVDSVFSFKLLSEKRRFDGELQTIIYKYLVFAKEAGVHDINLKPVMLFTSQSAIDNVIVGRDNVNDLEVQREEAKIKPIKVKVSKTTSSLTGILNVKTDLDLDEVSAYEPVHLEIVLSGEGNLHELPSIVYEIQDVQVFADKVEKNLELTEHGYRGEWIQRFAFVGKKDFVIPELKFSYFDVKDQKEKLLKTEAMSIKIKTEGIQRAELIDEVNFPSDQIDFSKYLSYLYYLLSFTAGFLIAKLVKLPSREAPKFQKGEKIKKAKSAKELLEVLIMCDRTLFSSEIESLEEGVYKSVKIDFSKLKNLALKKL